ncbi:MAG TPA: patatin-like phospholipase family protein [Burkholderiaceae bacterium]|nr:patatin-like phospholipase family protein [Burkholderiaceae bacterium]
MSEPNTLTALVLQGGGALGAYQGGAYEALAAAGREPDWLAGISIGAINSALIAGNAPERRTLRLREFWQRITAQVPTPAWAGTDGPLRAWANDWGAAWGAAFGLPHFFQPRMGAPWWPGAADAPSLYDTAPLRETLLELVDFDRINDGPVRLSVGAVDVESGNFVYFDSRRQRLRPEHIMASGALPPGFPAVVIDGRAYWDGGLVSNTPLRHVVEHLDSRVDATIFQVDLFNARGALPCSLAQVADREKDIRFSSRTRALTDMLRERHDLRQRLRELAALLPASRRGDARIQALLSGLGADAADAAVTLVHLIHRHKGSETQTRDYEFSRTSMLEHWDAGRADMAHSLHRLQATTPAAERGSFRIFDYTHPDKETSR